MSSPPAGDEPEDGLTGVPSTLSDGQYLAEVVEVLQGGADRGTVRVRIRDDGGEVVGALLPASRFGGLETVDEGAVYEVGVGGGRVVDVELAFGPTVQRAAPGVDADRFAVPLRHASRPVGDVERSGSVLSLARDHSLLVTGEPGAGKTEFVKLLLPQIESDDDEPVVVFNYKDDYTDWAREHAEGDVVRLSVRDSTDYWNLFREVEEESEYEQLARTLFADRIEAAEKTFFPRTACQLFEAVCKYLHREGRASGLQPDMRELRDFFSRFGSEEVYELLSAHDDLKGALEAINPDARKQAAGVYATLQMVVRELFTGDFAREDGTFSIREYMADPDGRVLLLDYPIAEGDRVTPVFRLWIDRAIRFALADRTRGAYFVLDEFGRIPQLEMLDELVTTGRARQTIAILGLQSLSQLGQHYDTDTVDALLSGLTQEVFLRCGDARTVEYVRDRIAGADSVTRTVQHGGTDGTSVSTSVSHSPSRGRLQRLDDGEAVVYATRGWVQGRVPMWSQLDRDTRWALVHRREPARAGRDGVRAGTGQSGQSRSGAGARGGDGQQT